jgi:pimeloyl-ACP methyl ester carboxylesterase
VLVLAATSLWIPGPGEGPRGPLHRRALMALYRGVTAALGRAPIRALGAGTADEAATYVAQITGWTRAGRWTSLRGVDYLSALAAITTPVWPIAGTGDWMCTPHDAISLAARIPTAAPARIVGRGYGDAIDPDHFELFTSPALRPVWDELIAALTAARA